MSLLVNQAHFAPSANQSQIWLKYLLFGFIAAAICVFAPDVWAQSTGSAPGVRQLNAIYNALVFDYGPYVAFIALAVFAYGLLFGKADVTRVGLIFAGVVVLFSIPAIFSWMRA